MATSKAEMVDEVRTFGQYSVEEVSDSDLELAVSRAENHLVIEARLDDPKFYSKEKQEEALFWCSLLFSKVQTGALDAKMVAVGAIEESELRAHSDGNTTEWYRRYRKAVKSLTTERLGERVVHSARTQIDGDRYYENRET